MIYDGITTTSERIPIITKGGGNEFEFVRVSHSDYFHRGYKYIIALKPCTECIDDMTVYQPITYVGDFQGEAFSKQRSELLKRSRTGSMRAYKDCRENENSILYISLGNINVDFEGNLVNGSMDVKVKTNDNSKPLISLSMEMKYDNEVFGENAIANQVILPTLNESIQSSSIAQYYSIESQDIQLDQAQVKLEKDASQGLGEFLIINTVLQPTMQLHFSIPLEVFLNFSTQIDDLIDIISLDASFFCDGRVISFDEIVFEDYPIGINYEGSGGGGITYSFENLAYNSSTNALSIDLFASSPQPTILDAGRLLINYNSNTFLPFQQSNDLLDYAAGADFFSYLNPFSNDITDVDAGTLQFDFESPSNASIDDLVTITSEGTYLFTFTLTFNDCDQSPDLSFNETEMQDLSFYFEEQTFPIPIVYETVIANDSENTIACGDCSEPIIITEWDPTQIVAGDNQILTIKGNNFGLFERGANPGMDGDGSSVLFYNGDFSPSSNPNEPPTQPEYIAAGKADFEFNNVLKWTDTEIKVKVPSSNYDGGSKGPYRWIIRRRI
ncbi:MAG: hypothetical protein MI974_22410 [Chitinophagales bacterium]|nr:hypothetical protein [Chitinophagales bacterium]